MKPNYNSWKLPALLFLLLTGTAASLRAATVIDYDGNTVIIGQSVSILEDPDDVLTIGDIMQSADFWQSTTDIPNFGISNSTFWIKFSVQNNSTEDRILLELANPKTELCELYALQNGTEPLATLRHKDVFTKRYNGYPNVVLDLPVDQGHTETFFLKLRGDYQLTVPLILISERPFLDTVITNHILVGIHIGILLAITLYNMFLYASIKDKNYIYYILYIIFIGLSQTTITGYTFKFLWPDSPHFDDLALILFPALAGVFAIIFFQNTLHTKDKVPYNHQILNIIMVVYVFAIIVRLSGSTQLSYRMIDVCGLLGVTTGIIIAIKLSLQNYRPAKFFLLAWSIFLIGIILYVARNLNLLPYNTFTNYTMQVGTAIEVILLSFALADRINTLKKDKETSQKEALETSLENQRIVQEQNLLLERKVNERTVALTHANSDLSDALSKLQNAQSSLIQSEKMASLGQLTAGVAHEINNPINFVSSNIKPLQRDINDLLEVLNHYEALTAGDSPETLPAKLESISKLKEELDLEYTKTEVSQLLKGIEEGANRTVGIVRELKNFSRLDESDYKQVNLNEGINSTLVILNYQLGTRIQVIRELGDIPEIDCYAGKMNQVFMNIISNSIFVLENNPVKVPPPTIHIKTWLEDDGYIALSFKDNGVGIAKELQSKIFDPFFTTKDVGKGTGLGLSIVFKIIEAHNGNIQVFSEKGEGTEFLMKLPLSV